MDRKFNRDESPAQQPDVLALNCPPKEAPSFFQTTMDGIIYFIKTLLSTSVCSFIYATVLCSLTTHKFNIL